MTADGTSGPSTSQYTVHCDKAYFSYAPGQQRFQQGYLGVGSAFVTGVFHLRFASKPLSAREIRLSLTGTEKVKWTEEASAIKTSYKAEKQILSLSTCLWRCSSDTNEQYETIKNLDLPFRLSLPPELPSSVELPRARGKILYLLRVTISRQPKYLRFRASKKKIVEVICPITRYSLSKPPEPTRWVQYDDKRAISKGVGYDVALEQTTFRPDGEIIIPLRLTFHKPRAYLKKVTVGIKEYIECRAAGGKHKYKAYVMDTKVTGDQVPILPGTNECSTLIKTFLPPESKIYYSLNGEHISVSHKIKVNLFFGKANDIKLEKDIRIENSLSEEVALDIYAEEDAARAEEQSERASRIFMQEQRSSQLSLASSFEQRSIRSSRFYAHETTGSLNEVSTTTHPAHYRFSTENSPYSHQSAEIPFRSTDYSCYPNEHYNSLRRSYEHRSIPSGSYYAESLSSYQSPQTTPDEYFPPNCTSPAPSSPQLHQIIRQTPLSQQQLQRYSSAPPSVPEEYLPPYSATVPVVNDMKTPLM